jgi:hypothetical protein
LILGLDEPAALDPGRAGAKAALLARARQIDLPVLPGFVIEASASSRHMGIGAAALPLRGSGGARLAVMAESVPEADEIVAAGGELAGSLLARSSTLLEGGGEWAGAFASYVGISPEELPKAVAGCWASAFSVDALGRQVAGGLEPGSMAMAVLVQPAIAPVCGGVAEIESHGTIVVHAVGGSPVSLLQGWERGVTARRPAGEGWKGEEAVALASEEVLDELASVLEGAADRFGVNRCEWGISDRLWLLQLSTAPRPAPVGPRSREPTPAELIPLVRAVAAAPGVLGDELVLPWALGGLPWPLPTYPVGPGDLVHHAVDIRDRLVSRVWGRTPEEAVRIAGEVLRRLQGPDPAAEVDVIRNLDPPDLDEAAELMSIITELGRRLAAQGAFPDHRAVWHLSVVNLGAVLDGDPVPAPQRVGVGRWEPLAAAVVLDHGEVSQGTPAAAGIGAGLGFQVVGVAGPMPAHRAVVTAGRPLPRLSQLIWDAAGLVTGTGSPAAHVFETARALGVPAVCGVDIAGDDDVIVAVDGYSGLVATLSLSSQPIP